MWSVDVKIYRIEFVGQNKHIIIGEKDEKSNQTTNPINSNGYSSLC